MNPCLLVGIHTFQIPPKKHNKFGVRLDFLGGVLCFFCLFLFYFIYLFIYFLRGGGGGGGGGN